jgi:hypothetical protein
MGKSYLFTCLFASLHKKFLDAKGRQIQTPRPLPLLPQYMPYADATNSVKSLLRAYLQTDMARPLDVRLFEWMLEHGLTTWMLDGLDEVIERDPTFFDYLTDLILDSEPDTPPRVVICIRDSLITTNSAFRDFLEECKEWTAIYHMSPWSTPSKRAFARIALGSRSEEFLSAITASPELDSLASNPYYCEMLSAQFEIGEMRSSYSILELLQVALADIIRRDHRKKPPALDPNVLTEKVVTDFAEAMAATDLEEGFAGVGIDDARELALLSLPAGLTPDTEERLRDQLTKAGLFASGSMGRLRFAQEVLEQFLLGRWLAQVFFRNPPDVLPRLALRQLNPDSISAKVFADEVRAKKGESRLLDLLPSATDRPAAFKNVLQVAMLAGAPISDLPAGLLENRDLSAMSFVRSDLSEASLRNSDLSDTTFSGSLMRGVALEGATLRNTRFVEIGEDGMKDADFGSLTRFYSIVVDKNRVLDSVDAVNKWLGLRTAKERVATEPCRAAMQLRLVFGKYVRPNGAARRDWHDEKALVSGARHIDNTKELIRELVQAGYLMEDRRIRGRYHRPEGDEYGQMREYTTDLALSSSLKLVLDEVCHVKDCPHVPQISGG